MLKQGYPNIRSAINKSEYFINQVKEIHGDKYDYNLIRYVNNNSNVDIKCKIHNLIFKQTPANHLAGRGCKLCGKERQGYSKTNFINQCNQNNNGLGILYILHCFNEAESFYKIGITSKSVIKRFKDKQSMPYEYEVTNLITDIPENIYDLEHILHRVYKSYYYKPLIFFDGFTECFQIVGNPNVR